MDAVEKIEILGDAAKYAYKLESSKACSIGSQVHDLIENFVKTGKKPKGKLQENVKNAWDGFMEWWSDNDIKPIWSEVTLYGDNFAGTADFLAKVNGKVYLIDFKTSKGIYDEMKVQQCAYRQAYNEALDEGQEPVENLALLHLDKTTGEPTFKPIIKDVQRMTEFFNCLTQAYYLQKNRRLKNNRFVEIAKNIDKKDEVIDLKF